MTSTFELTSAYVIAAGAAATKHTAGGAAVRLSRGKTVLIPGHLAHRPYQALGPSSCVSPVPLARLLSSPKTFTSNAVSIQREAL